MNFNQRTKLIFYLIVAIICIVLLASTLPALQLKDSGLRGGLNVGQGGPELTSEANPLSAPGLSDSTRSPVIVTIVLITATALAFTLYRYRYARQTMLVQIAIFVVLTTLFTLFNLNSPGEQAAPEVAATPVPTAEPAGIEWTIPDEVIDNPPDIVSTLLTIGLFIVLGIIGFIFWRWLNPAPKQSPAMEMLELLAQDAELTITELRAGGDVSDAVMRCYLDMSQTLQKRLSLARPQGMTPREFQWQLIETGLPARDVERLTRLFERVRYGNQQSSPRDKMEALACLEAIVNAAGSSGPDAASSPPPQPAPAGAFRR